MSGAADAAIVLAAGRGTRMQQTAQDVPLDAAQLAAARRGAKPLIPISGRPFIEYQLSSLADAGYTSVCMVTAAGDESIRDHCRSLPTRRLSLSFAVQKEPLGTADALLAAEAFAGDRAFTVINADNLYPVAALAALRASDVPATVGFTARGLLRGHIDAARLTAYALLQTDTAGVLTGIREKPPAAELQQAGSDALISMTCWRFDVRIFDACRSIGQSPRGEYEIPDAVRGLLAAGVRVHVLRSDEPVPDLSRQSDIPAFSDLLRDTAVGL